MEWKQSKKRKKEGGSMVTDKNAIDNADYDTGFFLTENPENAFFINGAVFRVIRVKGLYQEKWRSEFFHSLVLKARESYGVYGSVPLEDEDDRDAAVYLVSASYKQYVQDELVSFREWFCVRFIPGNSTLAGMEFMRYNNLPIAHLFRKRLLKRSRSYRDVITISKICRILPTAFLREQVLHRLRFSYVSFALANLQFFFDVSRHHTYKYVTGIFREELIRTLIVPFGTEFVPNFVSGKKMLGLAETDILRVDEKEAVHFPTYFFYAKDVVSLLSELIKDGLLSIDLVDKTIGSRRSFFAISKDPCFAMEELKGIGELFIQNGPLPGSKITGEELRSRVGRLPNAPKLQIMSVPDWSKSINKLLHISGVTQT
jgi:hypothetical protein